MYRLFPWLHGGAEDMGIPEQQCEDCCGLWVSVFLEPVRKESHDGRTSYLWVALPEDFVFNN